MTIAIDNQSHEISRLFSGVRKQFTNVFNLVLCKALPNKTKRLIFLSSIVASIEDLKEPDKKMVAKINELLALSHKEDAISLPMYVHSTIWKNQIDQLKSPTGINNLSITDIKNTCLTIGQMRAIANIIINKTPQWMIYGSRKTIREDLMVIFKNMPTINACKF